MNFHYSLEMALANKRSNNLSFIRFIAALLVIVSHAFPLSLGADYKDWLGVISNGKLTLGGLAVGVFFMSSGLLISRSIERNNKTFHYLKARCIRIFPPLIIMVLFSILIIGPIFTNLAMGEYFTNTKTYLYSLNALLVPIHNLPEVFTNNIYEGVVNGALWTLPVEFACYIGLLIACKIKLLNKNLKYTLPFAVILFILIFYTNIPIFNLFEAYILPVFLFYIGMLFYIYRSHIFLDIKYACFFLILWFIFVVLGYADIAMILFFPYIFVTISFYTKQCSETLAKTGNISYGIYLCGFAIQQCIVYLFGGSMNVYLNMILSIPVSILIGYIIYYFGEKKLIHKAS